MGAVESAQQDYLKRIFRSWRQKKSLLFVVYVSASGCSMSIGGDPFYLKGMQEWKDFPTSDMVNIRRSRDFKKPSMEKEKLFCFSSGNVSLINVDRSRQKKMGNEEERCYLKLAVDEESVLFCC